MARFSLSLGDLLVVMITPILMVVVLCVVWVVCVKQPLQAGGCRAYLRSWGTCCHACWLSLWEECAGFLRNRFAASPPAVVEGPLEMALRLDNGNYCPRCGFREAICRALDRHDAEVEAMYNFRRTWPCIAPAASLQAPVDQEPLSEPEALALEEMRRPAPPAPSAGYIPLSAMVVAQRDPDEDSPV